MKPPKIVSTIHSMADPFDCMGHPLYRFVPLGSAPLNMYHIALLVNEPITGQVKAAYSNPVEHSPNCVQYVLNNLGGSFTGYLFAVNTKLTKFDPYRISIGDEMRDMLASPVNGSNPGVFVYRNKLDDVLIIPADVEGSRHVVGDGDAS